jgi:hypothetical protein
MLAPVEITLLTCASQARRLPRRPSPALGIQNKPLPPSAQQSTTNSPNHPSLHPPPAGPAAHPTLGKPRQHLAEQTSNNPPRPQNLDMADAAPAKKIWLASNDNATIEVDRVVAERSMLIKNLLEDTGDDSISQENPIPIPNLGLASCRSARPRSRRGPSIPDAARRSTRPFSGRSSSGASTTRATLSLPPTTITTLVRRRPTSKSGTRSSCRWTRRCSSRSFSYANPHSGAAPRSLSIPCVFAPAC